MEALASLSELAERLPFTLSPDDERDARGILEDLSDDARHYGRSTWVNTSRTPRQICRLVLRAAVRHMRNPDGYTQSRAGDESVSWTDRGEDSGSAYFTDNEREMIRTIAGKSSVYSVGTYNMCNHGEDYAREPFGFIPDESSNEPIHFFAHKDHPW